VEIKNIPTLTPSPFPTDPSPSATPAFDTSTTEKTSDYDSDKSGDITHEPTHIQYKPWAP